MEVPVSRGSKREADLEMEVDTELENPSVEEIEVSCETDRHEAEMEVYTELKGPLEKEVERSSETESQVTESSDESTQMDEESSSFKSYHSKHFHNLIMPS